MRELQEGQRPVLVLLTCESLEVRDRLVLPGDCVVRHLVGRGRMHLRLSGDDHTDLCARPFRQIAPQALAVEAGLAEGPARLREHREVGPEDHAVAALHRTDAQRREQARELHLVPS